MNTHRRSARSVFRFSPSRRLAAALFAAVGLIGHSACAAEGDTRATSPALPTADAGRPVANTPATGSNAAPATALSPIVGEVLKIAIRN